MKRIALLLAVVLCAVSVLGAFAVAEDAADDVMAMVNGAAVTAADVDAQFAYLDSYFTQQGYDTSVEENAAVLRQWALEAAVEAALMHSKAEELGYTTLSDEELADLTAAVGAQWNDLVDMCATYYFGLTEDADEEAANTARTSAMAYLESMGYTEELMLNETLNNDWYEKMYAHMVEGAAVTEEDVVAAFEARVAEDKESFEGNIMVYEYYTNYGGVQSYYVPEGYRGVRHILLPVDEELMNVYTDIAARLEEQAEAVEAGTEQAADETADAPVTQADLDAAAAEIIASIQPTLDEIYQKLADGVSFSELIAQYGTDPGMTVEPSKTNGYDVHIESFLYVPEFTKGAFTVEHVGDVTEPIISNYGVHIMEYTRDIPAGAIELTDEIRLELMEQLAAEAESLAFNQQMEAWLTEANVEYTALSEAYLGTAADAQ